LDQYAEFEPTARAVAWYPVTLAGGHIILLNWRAGFTNTWDDALTRSLSEATGGFVISSESHRYTDTYSYSCAWAGRVLASERSSPDCPGGPHLDAAQHQRKLDAALQALVEVDLKGLRRAELAVKARGARVTVAKLRPSPPQPLPSPAPLIRLAIANADADTLQDTISRFSKASRWEVFSLLGPGDASVGMGIQSRDSGDVEALLKLARAVDKLSLLIRMDPQGGGYTWWDPLHSHCTGHENGPLALMERWASDFAIYTATEAGFIQWRSAAAKPEVP
jgi:hypothetical protein